MPLPNSFGRTRDRSGIGRGEGNAVVDKRQGKHDDEWVEGKRPAETFRAPRDLEDLLPQWDTVNEEEYFVRESDGKVFSSEEAGQYFLDRDAARKSDNGERRT